MNFRKSGFRDCVIDRLYPGQNIAGTYNTLPALGRYIPRGYGFNPGDNGSPAYMYPPFPTQEGPVHTYPDTGDRRSVLLLSLTNLEYTRQIELDNVGSYQSVDSVAFTLMYPLVGTKRTRMVPALCLWACRSFILNTD